MHAIIAAVTANSSAASVPPRNSAQLRAAVARECQSVARGRRISRHADEHVTLPEMRIAALVLLALLGCSKSSSQAPDTGSAAPAGSSSAAAAPADCSKLDAPVKAMFERMGSHIAAIEVAFADGGDCKKLEASLRALDTPGYMEEMKGFAMQMKPLMTPSCEDYLNKLGGTGEATFKGRFEKILVVAKAAHERCTDEPVRAAIGSTLQMFMRKKP